MAEADEYTEIKLTVPWGHVAAKTYGSSTGKPVLLLHGRLDNAGSFTRLMKYLPKELFYYVCIDLPGHGRSSPFPPWMLLDFLSYAHALFFILEALQWKTCICMGHSVGAQIALFFTVLHPNKFTKLILLDGILMSTPIKEFIKDITAFLTEAVTASLKVCYNEKSRAFTKDELLHVLKTKRMSFLNSEAAEALFERAATKVNEKYLYTSDARLKVHPFTYFTLDQFQKFSEKLSIPIYLVIASHGLIGPYKGYSSAIIEMMKRSTMLTIMHVDGNHDVHNNNPEKVAPFVCEILNNISKL